MIVTLGAVVCGCTARPRWNDVDPQPSGIRGVSFVTGEWLARTTAATAYDALEHIPAYAAHARQLPAPRFSVTIDGVVFVGLDPLKAIPVSDVCEIRLLTATTATEANVTEQIAVRTRERCLHAHK
jgi:hypothetical protein